MATFAQGVDANVPNAGTSTKAPEGNGPPRDKGPSELLQILISRTRAPSVVIDFPRYDPATGEPVQKVMIRTLTLLEEDSALARGRRYAAAALQQKTSEEQPEELAHNAKLAEVIAIAARDPEDPAKPFFRYGVGELREFCTAEEIGTLARAYARLRDETHPRLRDLNKDDLEAWIDTIGEGVLGDPFSYFSHAKLATLCEYAVTSLVALRRSTSGSQVTESSSSG